jgi:hypothetical protein
MCSLFGWFVSPPQSERRTAPRGLPLHVTSQIRFGAPMKACRTTAVFMAVAAGLDAEPTVVSATPAGPLESRADGSTCRPLRLTATKQSRTVIGTPTICRAAGSTELKPATRIQMETSIRSESREPWAVGQANDPSSTF